MSLARVKDSSEEKAGPITIISGELLTNISSLVEG
jgi:hypothetical protein